MRAGCKLKNIPECRSELVSERGKAGRVSIILKNRIFRQFYQGSFKDKCSMFCSHKSSSYQLRISLQFFKQTLKTICLSKQIHHCQDPHRLLRVVLCKTGANFPIHPFGSPLNNWRPPFLPLYLFILFSQRTKAPRDIESFTSNKLENSSKLLSSIKVRKN